MRPKTWTLPLMAGGLAFTVSFACVGCLQTAFGLPLETPALPGLVCGGTAFLWALLCRYRHGGAVGLGLLVLLGFWLWQDGTAAGQLLSLITRISILYDRAYHWGVLALAPEDAAPADWPLAVLGCLLAALTCWAVSRKKSPWPVFLAALAGVLPCFVVTDTAPGALSLLVLLAGLSLVFLTDSVRRENSLQALRLLLMCLLPVTLGLILTFLAIPKNTYVNRAASLREELLTTARNFPDLLEFGAQTLASAIGGRESRQVDLAGLGPRVTLHYPILEVTAPETGVLYLRGQDYDGYDGSGWTSSDLRTEDLSRSGASRGAVTIRTRSRRDLKYLPYYPGEEAILTGGRAENPEDALEYTVPLCPLPDNWRITAVLGSGTAGSEGYESFLALPEETRHQAQQLLEGLYPAAAGNTEKADAIAALVSACAQYDRNSPRMPEGEPDFALWFLRSCDRGYCVHFATAVTVLLRSAGVPARYVTGYMTRVTAGQTVTVTQEDSHAWAEYYEPRLDAWIPLEATPSEGLEVITTLPTQSPEPSQAPPALSPPETAGHPEPPVTHPTAAVSPSPAPSPDWLAPALTALLSTAAAAMLILGQRIFRRDLRRRKQRKGPPNAQALLRWQEAILLSRLLHQTPPQALTELAEKAKFSHHDLSPEELQQFESYLRTCRHCLREKPWYLRLIHQYIFAAY